MINLFTFVWHNQLLSTDPRVRTVKRANPFPQSRPQTPTFALVLLHNNNNAKVACAARGYLALPPIPHPQIHPSVCTRIDISRFIQVAYIHTVHIHRADASSYGSREQCCIPACCIFFDCLFPSPVEPSVPQNLIVTGVTADSISVSWMEPQTLGDTSVNYTVTVIPMDAGNQTVTGLNAVISGLKAGTMYTISVSARNSVGSSMAVTVESMTLARELTFLQA